MQKGFAGIFILLGILVAGLGVVGAWYMKIIQIPNLPPPGCRYQQVQCIKAPCKSLLVCGGPALSIQPISSFPPPDFNDNPSPAVVLPSVSTKPTPTGKGEINDWQASCLKTINNPETKYKECEMIGGKYNSPEDKQLCEGIGGQYLDCTSPCRHDPPGTICIQVCIPLCKFQ